MYWIKTHPRRKSCELSFEFDCGASPGKICRIGILDSLRTSWHSLHRHFDRLSKTSLDQSISDCWNSSEE
jgi:hypothetical protein